MQTQYDKILATLRRNAWVSNKVLNKICFRYGARIYDLRRRGHVIEKKHTKGNPALVYYRLGKN